jgi:hypothetical protein
MGRKKNFLKKTERQGRRKVVRTHLVEELVELSQFEQISVAFGQRHSPVVQEREDPVLQLESIL